jgi:predicted aspartyl protease
VGTKSVPVSFSIRQNESKKIVELHALIDCGAGSRFINQNFARKIELELIPLAEPLPVRNVNGTLNKKGMIRNKV